ncbi:ABC transporter family substrate-binding protein [Corynebacterium sp. CCM 8835]|uniref:ABC transporter family substrate-binding protein n=1 Tax=Corynebacterium antarcticum TaxID=2800405 RepID=A0ABS1FMT2_9CORY|nr:ABC transporter family substrate-binding protein [Corynebacterium antarcticum]MCK7642915.1 ABC transporter family substrate-binding protein [Corynebacterium antarcticum]MCK7661418.1 ABC transporter family substrate-binding protein [Corynebacterium antarcticum]MCL0246155.1 ABC transporter family substrate-binding protein [Corynebacterium antarcticum]MCX7492404.1 ABC transporter family substrate-binding protein [Corynebacterium antarcticum]MCX7540745.1 ABC transporter family substrate-binding
MSVLSSWIPVKGVSRTPTGASAARRPRPLRWTAVALTSTLVMTVAGCSSDEPTPLPATPAAGSPSVIPQQAPDHTGGASDGSALAQEITIGIDPLDGGFNPHLISQDSAFVQALADLVLPGVYVNDELNTDLVESVDFIDPPTPGVAQTVRYELNPAAQWSDGTPITGADFSYLRDSMVSTPGVIGAAGYGQISAIRTSGGGRTVDVDFRRRVADVSGLFDHLLPSHLLRDATDGFTRGLDESIPAAGGRYTVDQVDRQRGIVTLVRNDRFWGSDPARTETLVFREIRSVQQGVQMLRSGQVSYFDLTPAETTFDAFSLLPDTRVSVRQREAALELTMSVTSPILSTAALRREFAALIDRGVVARLATGRSTDLDIPGGVLGEEDPTAFASALARGTSPEDGDAGATGPAGESPSTTPAGPTGPTLEAAIRNRPLRIAADPSDRTATAAANTIVDLLARKEVAAEVVLAPFTEIAGDLLPSGEVDAVVGRLRSTLDPVAVADRFLCPGAVDPSDVTASTANRASDVSSMSSRSRKRPVIRTGNLSGICSRTLDGTLMSVLAGEETLDAVLPELRRVEEREMLTVPLLAETRIIVRGPGIVVPDTDIEEWSGHPERTTSLLSTAAGWTAVEEQ